MAKRAGLALGKCDPRSGHEENYHRRGRHVLQLTRKVSKAQSPVEARNHFLRASGQRQNHLHQSDDAHPDPIPTMYVRSLTSFNGPEVSINRIFSRARQMAPCFLVFEDLDSIITDAVRSYFLNEVDGLKSNDGILIVGSTNHLERLDPGIAKRPSRFDRKYLFPNPNFEERILYSDFWRHKLADNKSIEFPAILNRKIASITQGFSFAYMQEAFIAALLAIAGDEQQEQEECGQTASEDSSDLTHVNGKDDDLNQYVLWRQLKIQVQILRAELGEES